VECRYCGAQMVVLHAEEPDEYYCPDCDSSYCGSLDEWSSEWDVWLPRIGSCFRVS